MITAKTAKELYDNSGHEVEQFLKSQVKPLVIKAASSGKLKITIHLGSLAQFDYLDSKITPLHNAVVEKLKTLGFMCSIECYGDKYVPPGLRDDDGNGPIHQNFGIYIEWY